MLRLERLELVQQAVELLVGDLGIVLDVVALFVVADRAAQLLDALLGRGRSSFTAEALCPLR